MVQTSNKPQRGQGLVEYALILVLVAVIVIAILTLLGPQVGNVFSRVVDGLGVTVNTGGGGGGGGGGGAMVLGATVLPRTDSNLSVSNITVSENTSITLVDQVDGASRTVTCNSSCSVTFDLGHTGGGTVVITAPGNSISRPYGPVPPP